MMIKVVLFDLDGTLLPMDQDVFVNEYFGRLAKKLTPHGYEPQELIKNIWAGTKAMIKNPGEKLNEEVFWDCFASLYEKDVRADIALFDEFYRVDFDSVKEVCGFTPMAAKAVKLIKDMGFRIALATNPIFPAVATEARMRWAGLDREDFELYTTYENSRYSKPYPAYYTAICESLGVRAEECLMVGNDVRDDMIASTLGMKVFLLTDCLINKKDVDISQFPNGGFEELIAYIEKINDILGK